MAGHGASDNAGHGASDENRFVVWGVDSMVGHDEEITGSSAFIAPHAHGLLLRFLTAQPPASITARYCFALACCAIAFAFRMLLDPVLHEHSPLVLLALAVTLSAIRGGFGPGLLCSVLGAMSAFYFFPRAGSLEIQPAYRSIVAYQILVNLGVGIILSWLSSELRRFRLQAVETAEDRNDILESIRDGFAAFDQNWRFTYLNKAAEQLTGQPRDLLLGKNAWEEVPHLRGNAVEANLRLVSEHRTSVTFEYFFDDLERWFEFHAHPAARKRVTVYFNEITDRKLAELRQQRTLAERDEALRNVHLLTGLLPICAACKKIRDQQGGWQGLESYICAHSEAQFSHTMCPACAREYYGDLVSREHP
jgi:PAS domain S-box-containing protein